MQIIKKYFNKGIAKSFIIVYHIRERTVFDMTHKEIKICEEMITRLMYHPVGDRDEYENNRFARGTLIQLVNKMGYRVSIPDVDTVRIFKGD